MTVDERYDARVSMCRQLRILEDEIEKLKNIKEKYNQHDKNRKAVLSINIDGKSTEYELGFESGKDCINIIIRRYCLQKNDIVKILKQELEYEYS